MTRPWLGVPGRAVRALTGVAMRRSGPVPPLSRRNWLFDLGLALGLGLVSVLTDDGGGGDDVQLVPAGPGIYLPLPPAVPGVPFPQIVEPLSGADRVGQVLLFLLIVAPLVFRRRHPLSMLWIVLVTAAFVGDEAQDPLRLSFFVTVIAAYSAAVYSPYRGPALASLPVAAFLFARLQADAAEPALGSSVNPIPPGAVPYLILLPIAVAAYGLRSWRSRADAERAGVAEAIRLSAESERARIARELHDVVTHNVSVMVIQAGAARKVLDAAPEQAREALLAVEASGRAAMTELRHVMGLLAMEGDAPDLAPQPGLAELEALVGRVRDAGLPVEVVVPRQRDGRMPDGVDLAGYRVVQEALTNTVKHAPGASAVVRVDHGPGRLRIEVTDTGGRFRPAERPDAGSGRGLIGLRERLAVYGGTLQAAPRISGGYRVEAVIPFDPADAPDAERLPAEAR